MSAAPRAVATSERTRARRIQAAPGKWPLAFFNDLRIERAVHLLQTTRQSIDKIAAAVGNADGFTLATLLRRKRGVTARTMRMRDS